MQLLLHQHLLLLELARLSFDVLVGRVPQALIILVQGGHLGAVVIRRPLSTLSSAEPVGPARLPPVALSRVQMPLLLPAQIDDRLHVYAGPYLLPLLPLPVLVLADGLVDGRSQDTAILLYFHSGLMVQRWVLQRCCFIELELKRRVVRDSLALYHQIGVDRLLLNLYRPIVTCLMKAFNLAS
jgi:hypothetical protein